MKPIFEEFDKEFSLHGYENGDRLEYNIISQYIVDRLKEEAEQIIADRDLPLEVDVETWSRGGVPLKITLVVTQLTDNFGDTEAYENLQQEISW